MATIIVVQVGQCGNQVGERLFSKLHSHFKQQQQQQQQQQQSYYDSIAEEGRSIFFRGAASTARAILVDTEPKAIDATARAAGPGWRYDPRSQVTTRFTARSSYILVSRCCC
jgi:Tubulin/FtsZ family, GTPase domain